MKRKVSFILALLIILAVPMNTFAANRGLEVSVQRIYFMEDVSFSTEPVASMREVSVPTT